MLTDYYSYWALTTLAVVWGWVWCYLWLMIAAGVLGVVVSLVLTIRKRRQHISECGSQPPKVS